MRNFKNAALVALSAAALSAASDVLDLTKDTFPAFVGDNDLVLAEFFAPWCGHCKALAPEYEEAATQLKEKGIPIGKVDCTVQTELCQDYGVEGYPTLKVFRGADTVSPYTGQRKADAIISYMTKQSMPAVSDITKDTIEEFKTADKVVLVAFFDKDDKASNETFLSVANGLRDDYLFGATNDATVAKAEGVEQPAVVLYKSFDEGKDVFTEKLDKEAIEKFIKTASTPLIGEVGPATYSGYMAAGIPLAYIFSETPEEREELTKELKPVAEAHKGVVNFAVIDAKQFGQHGSNLNLEVGKWPAFAIQDTVKNQKYPLDQSKEVTAKEVGQFVDDFVAGKVEPSIKSEPIPEKKEGAVTVVVAHSYQQEVIDNDKDVLLEFYAPWCGHCKALSPKYDELAALYAKNPDFAGKVSIAKIDATANDVPDEIQGFPTIKLFRAGKKDDPVDYSGSRTVEDLAAFVKENGSHGVDAFAQAEGKGEEDKEMPSQAPAATDKVKEGAKKAAEAVKSVVAEGDDEDLEGHDEL
ncbi:disulfide isomerase PDI1 protein [Saccharata proteae CBS 121410]|uniref:Protein disulfide-isomerase n=1 Tax=Saccharata proteae CBS 121410 TaxID=1314787 RepID=A0A9P4LX14_9PEZI|nr:disulfide isomerase PDI1 protein [Saccharata proteae CBS 121410]